MPYPEIMIRPMREDLTRLGVEELKTVEAVDETVQNSKGTLMVVVNSICGCAAGKARPGVALALQNEVKPDKVATVFAGADIEATERARSYFTGYGPSSPSIAFRHSKDFQCGGGNRARTDSGTKARQCDGATRLGLRWRLRTRDVDDVTESGRGRFRDCDRRRAFSQRNLRRSFQACWSRVSGLRKERHVLVSSR